MEPIRVLHENAVMDMGGIESFLMNVYRNIDREKVQFDFMVHRSKDAYFDKEIEELGGRIYKCSPFNPLKHFKYMGDINRVLSEHNDYKIIHAHSELNMWSLKAAKKHKIPVRISHSHSTREIKDLKWIFMEYEKLSLKNQCTNLFACSKPAAKWLYGERAVEENKVTYIKNGIKVEDFKFDIDIRKRVKKELKLEDSFVIGHVGRFMKEKNHKFMLEIFKELKKLKNNAVLVLVGEGELEEEIKQKAKDMGIYKDIRFLGVRNDVKYLMQAMDVFLFPSFYEGLGIVLIEAQALGLISVVSENIPEEAFITDLVHKISLKNSADYWAKKIIDIYLENSKKRIGRQKDIINAGYDIVRTAKFLEDFYLESNEKANFRR